MSLDAALALPDLQPARAAAAKAQGPRGAGSASSASGAQAGSGSFSEALDDADRRADEAGSANRHDDDDHGKTVTATTTDAVPGAPASTAKQDPMTPATTSTIPSADAAAATTTTLPDTRAQATSLPSTGIDAAMLLAQGAMAGRDATQTTTGSTATGASLLPPAASPSGVGGVTSAAGASKPAGSVTDLGGKTALPSTTSSGVPSTAHGVFELPPASETQRLADRHEELRAQLAPMLAARSATPADVATSLVTMEAGASLWSPRAERGSDRAGDPTGSTFGSPGSSGTGTAASPLFAPVDASGAAASADGAGMAERMVEQVSWWLSQKTQGAEMTLDMANGQSVSVSVQVQGNEAQVAFRSDQADMRQLLTQAESQLKDLLGGQGLTLAGMSVGTQSGNAGQAQQQQSSSDGRRDAHSSGRSAVAVAPDVARPAGIGMRAPSGRSLDLYV